MAGHLNLLPGNSFYSFISFGKVPGTGTW